MGSPSVLGLNLGHNASAVLIRSDGFELRLEEEKLVQRKAFYGFPKTSFHKILERVPKEDFLIVNIGHKRIYEIFQSHRLLIKYCGSEHLYEYLYFIFDLYKLVFPKSKILHRTIQRHIQLNLNKKLAGRNFSLDFVDHHLSHALSAIHDAGFDDCWVVTQDGKGDLSSGKVYLYAAGNLTETYEQDFRKSLGLVYSAATKALGFKMLRHEGKVTGLAARGDSKVCQPLIEKRFKELLGGSVGLKAEKLGLKRRLQKRQTDFEILDYENIIESWVCFFKDLIKVEGVDAVDVAAGVQGFLESQVLQLIKSQTDSRSRNLALAGGVFANVKLNQRIWESGIFVSIFVQPAMDDAGTALGAASRNLGPSKATIRNLQNTALLGEQIPDFDSSDLPSDLKIIVNNKEELHLTVTQLIEEGKILGVVNGRAEWGPRALGNRSILANAFDSNIPEKLNSRLGRNDFMPFAPIVRFEDCKDIFVNFDDGLKALWFMTSTLAVKEEYRHALRAVTAVDGTARPQIISREDNEFLHLVLSELSERHGVGVVLNTSFNMHELPILSDLGTAFVDLRSGAVDYLIINNRTLVSVKTF